MTSFGVRWTRGMRCFALYPDEDRYYDARITAIHGEVVSVQYLGFEEDGDVSLNVSQIIPVMDT